ncbi:sensor histidine kinase [Sphaerisporangium melleum]|uniref:sensor histidine kinase n=1 Tax=Sphaerisporangium melleum TaxID=321316 RepID=UPI0016690ED8|nr:histidine kinase [Sphaerisporangium melleum]
MEDTPRLVRVIRRLGDVALAGFLGLLLIFDVGMAAAEREAQAAVPLIGLIGIGAYLLRHRFRVPGVVLVMGMSAAASVTTIALTWAGFSSRGAPGGAETVTILLLTVSVLRWVEPLRKAVWLAVAAAVVLELASLRTLAPAALPLGFLAFVGWAAAAGAGGYQRYQREHRRVAVDAVRRAERLELARELHDLVAHHITGIVVQAQAARTVAAAKPEALVPALDAIAHAGADALTSMRRLVGVLRASDDASRQPGTGLADLRVLVERFSASGPPTAFDVQQGLAEADLAPEVLTTLHRVLQEALTNVRRHAPHTRWVRADLRAAEGGVVLCVRNERSFADPRLSRMGGGYGLVGMAERVTALGGRLVAGPAADGSWETRAWFPADRGTTAS